MALYNYSVIGFLNYTDSHYEYKYANVSIRLKNFNNFQELIELQEYIYIPSFVFAIIVGISAEFKGGRFFFAVIGLIYLL